MKTLRTILIWALCACFVTNVSSQVNFSFTPIPLTTDFIRPQASFTLWNEQDAFLGTMHIPTTTGQPMQDAYHRFGMTQFFNNASASDSTIIFNDLDEFFNMAIDHKMGVRFRIMSLCNNCGNPPQDNFNNQVSYDNGWQVVPQFLHNLQQAEPVAANRDWFSTRGDQDAWVPNPNSPQFQRWVRKLSLAVKNHINSTSHNGVNYGDVLKIYDIGYNGCYSEQHYNCLCDNISEIPAGARHNPNDAGVIELIDAQTDAFGGDQRWKLVIPFNAFDAIWLPHTYNTVNYGNYILNHPDSIGWINDHIGADEGYDHSYLEDNTRINNAKLMNRWKFTPIGGEPVEWGSPSGRAAVPQYVQDYHMSFVGNGNLNGVFTNNNTTEANNFRLGSRLAGYRLRLTGGSANAGASLTINLNWLNEGGAPPYYNWTVQYLIKNGATTVSTLTSSFNPRYFQPSGAAVTKTDVFGIPAIPVGTYGLYVIVKDPLNYLPAMPLAITPQQSDGSYFLGNLTLGGGTNTPPVANAGPNQSISTTSVSLNGSSSSDPDGTISTYAWSQVGSTPNVATIVSASSANTNVTGLIAGVYVFNLTVTDDDGATASDQVQITVSSGNQPPIVDAGVNASICPPTTQVTVSATGSDDVAIISYVWTQVTGPNVATIPSGGAFQSGNITGLITGTYVFRVTVTDGGGLTAFDDKTVSVNISCNTAPIANAGPNQTIFQPASSVTLTGSGTDNGTITAYAWTQVGGPVTASITSPSSATTGVTGLSNVGAYIFRLTVTDNTGLTGIDDVQITVQPAGNGTPVANAGADQVITLPTNSVTVSSSASTDDVAIVSRLWTKTSGPSSFSITSPTSVSTSITLLTAGVYTFRITVTDGSALTDFDEVTITVLSASNAAPVANAGTNQNINLPTSSTTVNGSASTDDVGITVYLWTKVSGPAGGTITTPNSVSTTITALQVGTYVFRLRVQDAAGLFDTDDITIVVITAANNAPVAVITGGAQTIQLPTNSVSLSGTGSTDDVLVTAYLWTQISGPSTATITTPNASTTSMTNLVAGVYFFQLQVSDAGGLTDTDIVQITVLAADPPDPPIIGGRPAIGGNIKFLPRIP